MPGANNIDNRLGLQESADQKKKQKKTQTAKNSKREKEEGRGTEKRESGRKESGVV